MIIVIIYMYVEEVQNNRQNKLLVSSVLIN